MNETEQSHRKPPGAPRHVEVRVVEGPDAGATAELRGASFAVGAAEHNDLRLSDPTVSRYHVELSRCEGGVRVRDLSSLNGTWCGELRIHEAVATVGARFLIGGSTIELADGATRAESIPPPSTPIEGLVGTSPAIRAVRAELQGLAPSDVSVLLQGETGTGKEVAARALHRLSPRSNGPFEVVDCGSMPATLAAAELFGHERGAFTGADRQRAGAFERADGGTLFLDEVGELPAAIQPLLLGALERRCFRRVGGEEEIEVDVRVVAATHRDLREEVNHDAFRADLYYRLAVARVLLPPLRDRPEDIGVLVAHFVEQLTGEPDLRPFGYTALEALASHRWSGNARELRNVVEGALVLGQLKLGGREVPAAIEPHATEAPIARYRDARAEAIRRFEASYLARLIERAEHNASQAARLASMDRPYLLTLLRKHGLR